MLEDANVAGLADLDGFVVAMAGYFFDSKDDLEMGFLQLDAAARDSFLRQVSPDDALKWGVKVNVALKLRQPEQPKPEPTQQGFVPAIRQQMMQTSRSRPREDIPSLDIEQKLLFFGDESEFEGTGYYMTYDTQTNYMKQFLGCE